MPAAAAESAAPARRTPKPFWLYLAVLAALLSATLVPGIFTIDEAHYLATVAALRHGGVSLPDTAGLPSSPETAWFDPVVRSGEMTRTPISPVAPPLYAPIALPFARLGGFRALQLLDVFAFLATTWLTFLLASRLAGSSTAGWWAAIAYSLGGYSLEYAQGMWPHCLSSLIVLCALALTLAGLRRGSLLLLATAGVAIGVATEIRYQNAVVALVLLLLILLRGRKRLFMAASFLPALALPMLTAAAINLHRIGIPNPISKGHGYISSAVTPRAGLLESSVVMFWARVVDYSKRPFPQPIERPGPWDWLTLDARTGAPYCLGVVKKSWLQSSPWLALALAALGVDWLRRRTQSDSVADASWGIALLVGGQLAAFSLAGPWRDDMLGFNQRYLLELVAPLAILLGLTLARLQATPRRVLLGAGIGGAAAAAVLALPTRIAAHSWLVMKLPLVLAIALLVVYFFASERKRNALVTLAAAGIAWALVVHIGSDLWRSRRLRVQNQIRADFIERALPPDAAVFTWSFSKDFMGRLLAERDLVVASADYDQGRSAPALAQALLDRGTRVFVWVETYPPSQLARLTEGRRRVDVGGAGGRLLLIEIRNPTPG